MKNNNITNEANHVCLESREWSVRAIIREIRVVIWAVDAHLTFEGS